MSTTTDPTPAPANADALRAAVRNTYAAVARGEMLSCCSEGEGECASEINMIGDAYDGIEGYVADADLKLGCGLPVEHAGLRAGQTVLDLGAGAGLDAFVARRIVGDSGRVIGVDFTPEMVEKARQNATALGFQNVTFEHGDIERLPFADASIDVIISNCVLNLVPDKARAFSEMVRVLRPGGHFCVSDVVSRGLLPDAVRQSAELYAGCVAGALDQAEYLRLLNEAGFESVKIATERPIDLPEGLIPAAPLPAELVQVEPALAEPALVEPTSPLFSVTVRGVRPLAHDTHLRETLSAQPPAEVLTPVSDLISDLMPNLIPDSIPALQIYEPALCCSTGLCGPDPDETLVQFAADLKALSAEGVRVLRFNLSQSPQAFLAERIVHRAILEEGIEVLPIIVREGKIVSRGRYPSRAELAQLGAAPVQRPRSCC